jgi:hypothetical protein
MKNFRIAVLLILTFTAAEAFSIANLHFRFNNFYVVDGGANADTLIFDVEVRSDTAGTYIMSFLTEIQYNNTVFGANALPVAYIPYTTSNGGMVGPTLILASGPTAPANNRFRYGLRQLGGTYNPANLGLVPTSTWGKLIKYKMLIVNSTGNLGMSFYLSGMTSNEKYVKVSTTSTIDYSPLIADNDLLTVPATPTSLSLMLSELADPSDSNADFVEIYNPGPNNADLATYPWYLTMYNGTTYQNVQLTGTLNSGSTYVVAGSSFTSNYPGKTANLTASFIENSGTVTYYLSLFGEYGVGTTKDVYNGTTLPFTGKHAVRPYPQTSPNTTFTSSEWTLSDAATIDATPGSHRATITWDGTTDSDFRDTTNWTRPYVPDVGHNVTVPLDVQFAPVIPNGLNARINNLNVDAGAPPQ